MPEISRFGGYAPSIDKASLEDDEAQLCHNGTEVGGAFFPVYGMAPVEFDVPTDNVNYLFCYELPYTPPPDLARPLIMTFDTTAGSSSHTHIHFYIMLHESQSATIEWGDGTTETVTPDATWAEEWGRPAGHFNKMLVHDYPAAGVYNVSVHGYFGYPFTAATDNKARIGMTDVVQWGDTKIISLDRFFRNRPHYSPVRGVISANDMPNFQPGATIRYLLAWPNTLGNNAATMEKFNRWDVRNVVAAQWCTDMTGSRLNPADWDVSGFYSVGRFFGSSGTPATVPDLSKWQLTSAKRLYSFHPFYTTSMPGPELTPSRIPITLNTDLENYHGSCEADNGLIYSAPYQANAILEFNPATGETRTYGNLTGHTYYYCGVAKASNGKLYFAPHDAVSVMEFDPVTKEIVLFGNLQGARKYARIAAAPNGRLYCAPYNARSILEIDPTTRTTRDVGHTLSTSAAKCCGIAVASNGRVYAAPLNEGRVVGYDPEYDSGILISLWGGANLNQYASICAASDGFLYCAPFSAISGFLRVDPRDNTRSSASISGADTPARFGDIVEHEPGFFVCIPYSGDRVVTYEPALHRSRQIFVSLSTAEGKWGGGVVASNGITYGTPLRDASVLQITSIQLPHPYAHHPQPVLTAEQEAKARDLDGNEDWHEGYYLA